MIINPSNRLDQMENLSVSTRLLQWITTAILSVCYDNGNAKVIRLDNTQEGKTMMKNNIIICVCSAVVCSIFSMQ